jgi:dihydroorotase
MLFRNATLADGRTVDVRVEGESVAAVDPDLPPADGETVREAHGKLLLPGAVDVHVHFREPGFTHKETWATGSASAAAGGVTTVVDQPNTDPPTVDGAAFDEKAALAADSLVDWGVNGGVTPDWASAELFDRPLFALGEVFLADSTGDMGVDGELFREALAAAADAGVVTTVHAEDADLFDESVRPRRTEESDDDADAWSAYRTAEAEAAAVEQALESAAAVDGARLHVAHTSTPEGVRLADDAGATCEVTPHHLFLSRDDLADLGTFGRMNPPLRSADRRDDLFDLLADGTVDVVATDHAPHTAAEKDASVWDAPSGVPGVETMLPLLLAAAADGHLSHERVRDVTAANPADVFDLPDKGRVEPGADADLVLVDPDAPREIRGADLHSKAGWTPFEGREGVFPELTMVRGTVVWAADDPAESGAGSFGPAVGENVRR